MSDILDKLESSDAPAMGERRARWGYGYQDKVATDRILDILRAEIRNSTTAFEGVRLADILAGQVDDFVLVWHKVVEGNSIKFASAAKPMNWSDLIGSQGLIKELAEGYLKLGREWPDHNVKVRLQTNRPPSVGKHHRQIIKTFSVDEFLNEHWERGPGVGDSDVLCKAWSVIEKHTGLSSEEFREFVKACKFSLGFSEPPNSAGPETRDWHHYLTQFDKLHKSIAIWLTNNPTLDFIDRAFLLSAIGFRTYRSGLIQSFPLPRIPYEQNSTAAEQLRHLVENVSGGYIAITGCAGIGKSTLVQDVLHNAGNPYFVPYYAFLPDGQGNPRDRGEALTFFQDVVNRLDKYFTHRYSLGVADIAQGREALRDHMQKANEMYVATGQKTILLIDGLDHVAREVGLQNPVLHELPIPDEVPDGFLIILSSQPQGLLPGTITVDVGNEVAASGRRVTISGLSRTEVRGIVSNISKPTNAETRDRLYEACQGNPLILTYLLNAFTNTPQTSIDDVLAESGDYSGDIETYYASALSVPLEIDETRNLMGLLCRAAPTIPIEWLQAWPEHRAVETLYQHTLAPFVRIESGGFQFIHNSLIAFLKARTRSLLPEADYTADEVRYHSVLADRSANLPCANPLGRAHIFHLLRADRKPELLTVLSSSWLRDAVRAFLPYSMVRPLLLAGMEAAWSLCEYGHVMRLVLLDYELDQRIHRTDAADLAKSFLRLDEVDLAVSQVRSGGRLLVDDEGALRFSKRLYYYAGTIESSTTKDIARTIYSQAKPIEIIFHGKAINIRQFDDSYTVLRSWCSAAPLFESIDDIIVQISSLRFEIGDPAYEASEESLKSGLMYGALLTMLEAGGNDAETGELVQQIKTFECNDWIFAAFLAIAKNDQKSVRNEELIEALSKCTGNAEYQLALAKHLYKSAAQEDSKKLVTELKHVRIDKLGSSRSLGYTDVSYTVDLSCIQQLLSVPEGPTPGVETNDDEALARIEFAARKLGKLLGSALAEDSELNLRDSFRSIVLFDNIRVSLPEYDWRQNYLVQQQKSEIFRQLLRVAKTYGSKGLEALRDVILELTAGSAGTQISSHHRRRFAKVFRHYGVLNTENAVALGLSSTADAEDEDPIARQEACLEIAIFLHSVDDIDQAKDWIARAGQVSAGAGSHKDYHMAHLAEWIDCSIGSSLSIESRRVLEKFVRALEVAGGDGQSSGAVQTLQTIIRTEPSRASALAIELIDRTIINLSTTIEALIVGAADSGASPALLSSIYGELLSLIKPSSSESAAVAALENVPLELKTTMAEELMSNVKTNSLPSHRIEVARELEDYIHKCCSSEIHLSEGLQAGRDDSSRKSSLYKLANGQTLTIEQVAKTLSEAANPSAWNPNSTENEEFDWWTAINKCDIQGPDHLSELTAKFPPPDYRNVELLALKSKLAAADDDQSNAESLAKEALAAASKGSWFKWLDGASKKVAYTALKRVSPQVATSAARDEFAIDLCSGKLSSYFLMSDAPEIIKFLEIDWPAEDVLQAIEDYLDEVLDAGIQVDIFKCLTIECEEIPVDEAVCRFLIHLLAFPAVDIGIASRRCIAKYVATDGSALIGAQIGDMHLDSIRLEHLLIALHVGSIVNPGVLHPIKDFLLGLNCEESVAVRNVARRICDERDWGWNEVNDQSAPVRLIVPDGEILDSSFDEAQMLVGGELVSAAGLHSGVFRALEKCGLNLDDLRNEFARLYRDIEHEYIWADDSRLRRWLNMALTKFWLTKKAVLGREAAMKMLGRFALCGQAPPGSEKAYDNLYPIYDPAIELIDPKKRPVEMIGLDWDFMSNRAEEWLKGNKANDWKCYPTAINELHLIAERSWFIRPEWEWPREERYRGILDKSEKDDGSRESIASAHELTYDTYRQGLGQEDNQIVVYNDERQLAGPQYRWIAINSNIARRLNWTLSNSNHFEWFDSDGRFMIRSEYWKDGWIWLEPPRFEGLGEGWYVLASDRAVESIWTAFPDAKSHLWVNRRSHGDNPYEESWHLQRGDPPPKGDDVN